MPQLRQDRLTQEWVFVASESPQQPEELIVKRTRRVGLAYDPSCPLCPGHENRAVALPDLLQVPPIANGGVPVRVVSSRTQSCNSEGGPTRLVRLSHSPTGGLTVQEVIVEAPDHSLSTALLPEVQLLNVLRVAKIRFDELSRDPRMAHISLKKKHGAEAGAVCDHPHWQVTATENVPSQVWNWVQHARRHYGKSGTCIFCTVLQDELQAQERIVTTGDHFVALEPYASPTPFCTQIFPRRHMADFAEVDDHELQDLARILHGIFARFYHGLGDPDFACSLRNAPLANAGAKFYHWSLSLAPCLTQPGTTASGREMLLNGVLPEAAAGFLRSVRIEQAIPA